MKHIVAFSSGKDSQATLIWVANQVGSKEPGIWPKDKQDVVAVYNDTKWEHPTILEHAKYVTDFLGVKLVVLTPARGFIQLAIHKKRFPSRMAQFCTSELKVKPFIDYILDELTDQNLVIYDGKRRLESEARKNTPQHCQFFKFYMEPYKTDKVGKKVGYTYRKKEVLARQGNYATEIYRPVVDWTGQQCIDYIIANGQVPNPLYSKGAVRVGCYPCINSSHDELRKLFTYDSDLLAKLLDAERQVGSTFFAPDRIPKRFMSQVDAKTGKRFPTAQDVYNYVMNEHPEQLKIFDKEQPKACSSIYGLCG